MSGSQTTCWTLIEAAAGGSGAEREEFARRYAPVLRAYLAARWQASPLREEIDDVVQDVFVECFRPHGLLERADAERPGGFRAFLYGVARNLARRREQRRPREQPAPVDHSLEQIAQDESSLSHAFDRAWARAILREAARVQEDHARTRGEQALRRVELLRLRFHDGLPIRTIAERWGLDAAVMHHEYARARQEFRAALCEVVAFHHAGTPAEIEQECAELLALLG
jgi:RNA polymerase sigma-70 factor (ECF subfamily)